MSGKNILSNYLVVSEIDNTVLEAGFGIPQKNMEAAENFIERGGRFTFCTRRSGVAVEPILEWIPINEPAVLSSGGYIYDFTNRETLRNVQMKASIHEVLDDILDLFPQVGIEIIAEPDVYIAQMNRQIEQKMKLLHAPYVLCPLEETPAGWNKICFHAESEKLSPLEQFIQGKYMEGGVFGDIQYARNSESEIEITPKGVNKGSGLRALCELLQVPKNRVIVIGSTESDTEMFSAAWMKVCVADAPQSMRSNADLTVSSCLRGGLADVLNGFDDIVGNYEQLSLDL